MEAGQVTAPLAAAPTEETARVARRRSLVALCVALLAVPGLGAGSTEAAWDEDAPGPVLALTAVGLLGFVVLLVVLFRHFRTTERFRTQGIGPFIGAVVAVPSFAVLALGLGALVAAFFVEPEHYAFAGLAFATVAGAAIVAAHILADRVLWGLGIGLILLGVLLPYQALAPQPLRAEDLDLLAAAMAAVPALALALAEGIRGHLVLRLRATRS